MHKKLARMVLALAGENITGNALIAQETVAMLIVEEWRYKDMAEDLYDLVSDGGIAKDYKSAVALASWLLAQ